MPRQKQALMIVDLKGDSRHLFSHWSLPELSQDLPEGFKMPFIVGWYKDEHGNGELEKKALPSLKEYRRRLDLVIHQMESRNQRAMEDVIERYEMPEFDVAPRETRASTRTDAIPQYTYSEVFDTDRN